MTTTGPRNCNCVWNQAANDYADNLADAVDLLLISVTLSFIGTSPNPHSISFLFLLPRLSTLRR